MQCDDFRSTAGSARPVLATKDLTLRQCALALDSRVYATIPMIADASRLLAAPFDP
jgi:hypothetical protein